MQPPQCKITHKCDVFSLVKPNSIQNILLKHQPCLPLKNMIWAQQSFKIRNKLVAKPRANVNSIGRQVQFVAIAGEKDQQGGEQAGRGAFPLSIPQFRFHNKIQRSLLNPNWWYLLITIRCSIPHPTNPTIRPHPLIACYKCYSTTVLYPSKMALFFLVQCHSSDFIPDMQLFIFNIQYWMFII